MQYNRINQYRYADEMRDLHMYRYGKFRNIMVAGPANCGKSSMLKPLETVYHAFNNPTHPMASMPGMVQKMQMRKFYRNSDGGSIWFHDIITQDGHKNYYSLSNIFFWIKFSWKIWLMLVIFVCGGSTLKSLFIQKLYFMQQNSAKLVKSRNLLALFIIPLKLSFFDRLMIYR